MKRARRDAAVQDQSGGATPSDLAEPRANSDASPSRPSRSGACPPFAALRSNRNLVKLDARGAARAARPSGGAGCAGFAPGGSSLRSSLARRLIKHSRCIPLSNGNCTQMTRAPWAPLALIWDRLAELWRSGAVRRQACMGP